MVNYGFLFPGQGAQTVGMVKDICEEYSCAMQIVKKVSQITEIDVAQLLWQSDIQTLSRTDKSQIAITTASLCICSVLQEKGFKPSAVAGFSLGEWSALYMSGVLSFEETVIAVKKRGQIMQAVCDRFTQNGKAVGMAAVIGLEQEVLISLLKNRTQENKDIYAVNLNSTKQTVVAGTEEGLAWCEEVVKTAGARRFIRLKVAGPFHSPLMQQAADEFAAVIEKVTFNTPLIPLFSNVTGKIVTNPNEIKLKAVEHLISPVLWTSEEKALYEYCIKNNTVTTLLEVGPGAVLTGLWKDTPYAQTIECKPCGTKQHVEELCC